jgi:hypothetical protein
MAGPETKKVLIAVRTYPTPARTGVEVSCTAGISDAGEWIRLFPVPYRFLEADRRFRKYQWVEASVEKATKDARPESFRLVGATPIRIVSDSLPTKERWSARKAIVLPLRAASLCDLMRRREATGAPTLGLFRPKIIKRLLIRPDPRPWTAAQLAILQQGSLFGPGEPLEKVPFAFKYVFECDDPQCRGHTMGCTDWEMGAAWRRWRDEYGALGWEAKFRQRFETEMIEKNDTHFYVGTVHRFPATWIIVGLFYPPRPKAEPQGNLFRKG